MILLTTTSLEYINTHKHKNVVAGKTNFRKTKLSRNGNYFVVRIRAHTRIKKGKKNIFASHDYRMVSLPYHFGK